MSDESRAFEVVLSPIARDELLEAYLNAAQHAPGPAAKWLDRFEAAIAGLADNPGGCPVAREAERTGHELREMLFGKRPNTFRVLFRVEELVVQVLRIRRGSRRPLTPGDIRQLFGET